MAAENEYFITKLTFREDEKLIKDVFAYESDGKKLSDGETHTRDWLVNRTSFGYSLTTMSKNETGKWQRGNLFTYENNLFTWKTDLPLNITKRKTFVSYYHHDDQSYRERFENLFGDLVISKSVEKGDIDSDNSDDYIKQLIQKEFLFDTTVLVVLIGSKTKCRMHVDWEISGALNYKVGDRYAGLLGLFLPTHPNYGSDKYSPNLVPKRLAENFSSGYAIAKDWTDDRVKMQKYIEEAFSNRKEFLKIINKSIPQMTKDTCE
jgi:hypothetical protein